MAQAWIGLGSNLAHPAQQVRTALQALADLPQTRLLHASSLWHSSAWGGVEQPDFINAVALLHTCLKPLELLDELQAIEHRHQRQRLQHWGPRTLDLDMLLYDQQQIRHPRLILPHPYLHQRAFVLLPMAEIDPQLNLPGLGSISQLLSRLNAEPDSCRKLTTTDIDHDSAL